MEKLLTFIGMGLATYLTRYTMIAALGQEMPPLLRRWLRYVPPAALAALIAPAALAPRGHLEFGIQAGAVMAGAVIAWRTRSVPGAILGGMAIFWIWKALGL
ncbi:MAG TPA: AzlD domain-containing protein [Thermoflexia bacterium]|nr:MAG: AzlD domain-containing protein [Chloroflexota bacterium]HEY68180.1 AzlD domain-containing protein [Thermoflexia bacterium]